MELCHVSLLIMLKNAQPLAPSYDTANVTVLSNISLLVMLYLAIMLLFLSNLFPTLEAPIADNSLIKSQLPVHFNYLM